MFACRSEGQRNDRVRQGRPRERRSWI